MNLHINTQAFRFAYFEFQLILSEPTKLSRCKHDIFHCDFGKALSKISTNSLNYFYSPSTPNHWKNKEGQTPPKPYRLIPLLEDKTHYGAGDTLKLGIVLYGSAVDRFMTVYDALEHLGEFIGLGKQQSRFHIESIQQLSTDGLKIIYQDRQWPGQVRALHADHFFTDRTHSLHRIRLKYLTRLHLEIRDKPVENTPQFNLLINRLLTRINNLATVYGSGILIAPKEKRYLLSLANTVQTEHSNLQWQDEQRDSHANTMPFGGLMGETVYSGELAPFMPWLELGQWIGVGEKTSFGLGHYQLGIINADA